MPSNRAVPQRRLNAPEHPLISTQPEQSLFSQFTATHQENPTSEPAILAARPARAARAARQGVAVPAATNPNNSDSESSGESSPNQHRTQPASDPTEDKSETSSPFVCPLCCEDYSTTDKEKEKRPHSYECGHTSCRSCIDKTETKKCPFCNQKGKTLTINYALEQAIDWNREHKNSQDEKCLYNNQSLCLTCMETFDPNQKMLFGRSHKTHTTVPLKDKNPRVMKKVFWLMSILKSDGAVNLGRTEVLLRTLLDIVDSYLQAFQVVKSALNCDNNETALAQLTEDVKTLIQADTMTPVYQNKHLLDSLLSVRELEVEKCSKIFSLAKECSIPQATLLTQEVFEEIKRDAEAFVPVGMDESRISSFPLLSHTTQAEETDTVETKPSKHWLDTWFSGRPQIAVS